MPRARKPTIERVSVRLFSADIARLKRRAAEAGVTSWNDVARKVLHDALDAPRPAADPGSIYKFIIGAAGKVDATDEALTWSNMVAFAVANTEEEAREIVRLNTVAVGRDSRWLAVADVVILPCAPGTFIGQAWA